METGNRAEGKFHSQKGKEFVNGIKKLIVNNLPDEHDKEIVMVIINNVLNALNGKWKSLVYARWWIIELWKCSMYIVG